jgi:hypothetical protein
MARTRQVLQKGSYLSQAIPGYKGYTSSKAARRTDQVFSEEILSRLSETMATVTRMKRMAGDSINPDSLATLDAISESISRLATCIADTSPLDSVLPKALESGSADEIVGLDSDILEKMGNVSHAMSMMDLEGGAGRPPEEVESVCELLDDLGDSLKRRAMLIAG